MKKYPIILGIETSCDETAAAIIQNNNIMSNIMYSQSIHKKYGGVIPELASRLHYKNIIQVVNAAILQANITQKQLDAIAYTRGPGLIGSLLIGASFAKSLSMVLKIPLISVNHIHAHVLVNFIKDDQHNIPKFPYLCLMVSGGNTQIIQVNSFFHMKILGKTLDDAVGETFDKIGNMLGLAYPGGPLIDKYANGGNYKKFNFSKPKIQGLDFSFSGFKTHILYFLKRKLQHDPNFIKNNLTDICASVQNTMIDILIEKLKIAVQITAINRIAITGGVSANYFLRQKITNLCIKENWEFYLPNNNYTTDNAAMIAMVGSIKYEYNMFDDINVVSSANHNII